MNWFTKHDIPETLLRDPRFASVAEVRETFVSLNEELFWLAAVITGNADMAAACIVNATRLSEAQSTIFREWLAQWARRATVRCAVDHVRTQISRAAEEKYRDARCPHGSHEVLSTGEAAALRQWSAMTLAASLDPLSRSVLILRGVEHAAIQDCAFTLNVPRTEVYAAYCTALGWLSRGTVSQCNQYLQSSIRGFEQR